MGQKSGVPRLLRARAAGQGNHREFARNPTESPGRVLDCEKAPDPALGVGKYSLRSLGNLLELAHGSLGCTPLHAMEELKIECGLLGQH